MTTDNGVVLLHVLRVEFNMQCDMQSNYTEHCQRNNVLHKCIFYSLGDTHVMTLVYSDVNGFYPNRRKNLYFLSKKFPWKLSYSLNS